MTMAEPLVRCPDAKHPPLTLRRVDPGESALYARLLRPRAPVALPFGDGTAEASLCPAGEPADLPTLTGTIGGFPFALGLDHGTARRLLSDLPAEGADSNMAALALEAALSAPLEAWEERTGLAIRFERYGSETAPVGLALGLRIAATAVLDLVLPVETAKLVAGALDRLPEAKAACDDLTIPLTLELAALALPMRDVAGLQIGDAIAGVDAATASLGVAANGHAPLEATDKGWRLAGPITIRPKGESMPDTSAENADLDDLDIRLSFVAGRAEISLAELRALGPGSALPLGRAGAEVEILANGQRIGTGELVDLGGQSAVEIKTLFRDG